MLIFHLVVGSGQSHGLSRTRKVGSFLHVEEQNCRIENS